MNTHKIAVECAEKYNVYYNRNNAVAKQRVEDHRHIAYEWASQLSSTAICLLIQQQQHQLQQQRKTNYEFEKRNEEKQY